MSKEMFSKALWRGREAARFMAMTLFSTSRDQEGEGGSSLGKRGTFSPCSCQAGWQLPAEDPNAHWG